MAIAGVLELQLQADVARIRADMDRMQGIVSRGAQSMQKALDDVRSTMAGLFGGVSVAGFGAWIKGAIDFADELNDLNKTTSITIARLSGLALMSKQTGSDLTGIAQAMNKLTLEMGKAPEKFAKIGITAKDPLEAFKQLSEIFRSIEDPQLRAAVAAEALGKGWAAAAPALSEGSAAIERMVKRGQELAGILPVDAAASDEFNDSVSELQTALMGSATVLARDMLPLLTELVKSLTDVTDESNKADGGFSVLTETMRALIVFGGNVAFVIRAVAIEVGGLMAQLNSINFDWTSLGNPGAMAASMAKGLATDNGFEKFAEIGRAMREDAEKNRKSFDAWEQRMLSAGKTAKSVSADFRESERAFASMVKLNRPGVGVKGLRDFVGGDSAGKAAKAAADAAKKAREEYEKLIGRIGGKDSGVDADFLKNLNLLAEQGKKAGLPLAEIVKLQEAYIHQQPYMVKQQKESADLAEEIGKQEAAIAQKSIDYQNDQSVARGKALTDAMELLKAIEFETKALSMTNVEREKAIALRELENTGIKKGSEAYEELAPKIQAAIEQREAVKKHLEMWDSIDRTAHDVFVNIFEGGSNVFKKLGQTLKAALLDMLYQMTIKQWIINIKAQVSGGAMGGMGAGGGGLNGLSSLFGGGGGTPPNPFATVGGFPADSAMGSVLNIGSQFIGGSALTSGIGSLAGSLGFTNFAAGITGTAAGTAAAGTIGASIGAGAAAAIPYIGWVIALASLLGGSFKGETRSGATFRNGQIAHNPSGGPIGGSQEATLATITNINSMLAGLGSPAQLSDFFSGIEQSKKGKGFAFAGGMLSTGASFGQGVDGLGHMNRRGSMTVEQAMAAYAEELKQATLQALQAANVPGQLGEYLRSLGDIDKLSGGALDKALERINKAMTERTSLDAKWLEMTTTAQQKLAKAREDERKAIDASNLALLERNYALQDEFDAQVKAKAAIDRARTSVQQVSDMIAGIQLNIGGYIDRLNGTPAGLLPPEQQLANSRAQFERQLGLARAGDRDALQGITGYADQLIAAQTAFTASGTPTADTISFVKQALSGLPQMQSDAQLITTAIADGASQVVFSIEQLQGAVHVGFDDLDTNFSEGIDFTELGAYFGPLASDTTLRQLMSLMDLNGDGQITRLEALSATVASSGAAQVAAIAAAAQPNATPASVTSAATAAGVSELEQFRASVFGQLLGGAWADMFGSEGPGADGPSSTGGTDGIGDSAAAGVGGGGYAVGTNYVPYDMVTTVHRGERIVPSWDNPYANPYRSDRGGDDPALIAEIRSLREDVRGLRVIVADGARGTISAIGEVAGNTADGAEAARSLVSAHRERPVIA